MEWIKCSERMPEENECVLVFYPKDEDKAFYMGAWNIASASLSGGEWWAEFDEIESHLEFTLKNSINVFFNCGEDIDNRYNKVMYGSEKLGGFFSDDKTGYY